jgi:hypothetical protein
MHLEPVDSSIIAFRGHDPETRIMHIIFRDRSSGKPTSKYEYGNVDASIFSGGCAQNSFGSWFQREIKPFPKVYPFRKLADQIEDLVSETIDFAGGAPVPVDAADPVPQIILPSTLADGDSAPEEDRNAAIALLEGLKTRTTELLPVERPLVLADEASYRAAGTTVLGIRAAVNAFNSAFDGKIADAHKEHKRLITLKRYYTDPLEADEKRLDSAMERFRIQQRQEADALRRKAMRDAELEAEETAKRQAIDLQIHDAEIAEARGEMDLRDQILAAAPLPVAPAYVAPVYHAPAVPVLAEIVVKDGWDFNEEDIDIAKLPEHFIKRVPDVAAIRARVKSMGQHHGIPGVTVFPTSKQAKPRSSRKKVS